MVRRLIRVKTETGAARGRDEARKLLEAEFKTVRDQTGVRRRGARKAAEATGDMVGGGRGGRRRGKYKKYVGLLVKGSG